MKNHLTGKTNMDILKQKIDIYFESLENVTSEFKNKYSYLELVVKDIYEKLKTDTPYFFTTLVDDFTKVIEEMDSAYKKVLEKLDKKNPTADDDEITLAFPLADKETLEINLQFSRDTIKMANIVLQGNTQSEKNKKEAEQRKTLNEERVKAIEKQLEKMKGNISTMEIGNFKIWDNIFFVSVNQRANFSANVAKAIRMKRVERSQTLRKLEKNEEQKKADKLQKYNENKQKKYVEAIRKHAREADERRRRLKREAEERQIKQERDREESYVKPSPAGGGLGSVGFCERLEGDSERLKEIHLEAKRKGRIVPTGENQWTKGIQREKHIRSLNDRERVNFLSKMEKEATKAKRDRIDKQGIHLILNNREIRDYTKVNSFSDTIAKFGGPMPMNRLFFVQSVNDLPYQVDRFLNEIQGTIEDYSLNGYSIGDEKKKEIKDFPNKFWIFKGQKIYQSDESDNDSTEHQKKLALAVEKQSENRKQLEDLKVSLETSLEEYFQKIYQEQFEKKLQVFKAKIREYRTKNEEDKITEFDKILQQFENEINRLYSNYYPQFETLANLAQAAFVDSYEMFSTYEKNVKNYMETLNDQEKIALLEELHTANETYLQDELKKIQNMEAENMNNELLELVKNFEPRFETMKKTINASS